MAELYIFSQDDSFLTVLTKDTGLTDTWFKDYQNHIPDESFVFNIDSNSELLHHIIEENQVAFYDRDNELRLVRIKELYEVSTKDGHNIRVKCEPSFLELYDHFIEDKRITNGTAQTALNRVLDGSRYVGEVTVELGNATDNFYWINGIDAVWKILDTWGGALKDTITLDENNEIIERKLWIVQRLGEDNGLLVEPDYNAEIINRNTLSYPETALWGQGASLPMEDEDGELTGGHTRYITFEDVEWKVSNGDPVDKPKGQKWVGDPDALLKYGYKNFEGGRNLLLNSEKLTIKGGNDRNITRKINEDGDLEVTLGEDSGRYISDAGMLDSAGHISDNIKDGDTVTFSIKIKSPDSTKNPEIYLSQGLGYRTFNGIMSEEFSVFYLTVDWKDGTSGFRPHIGFGGINESTFIFKEAKLELGDQATPYSQAPEEMDNPYLHREGHFSNQDYDDPEELLWATWNELQDRKLKEVIHEATIYESDKKVSLGDTVTILSREYNKPIELQSQITGLEYDILYPDDEIKIVVGKYIDMGEDPLQKEVDDLKDVVNRPTKPINNDSFPDVTPGTPKNVSATGSFQSIQLFWDYDSSVYISHYEVYGSQISDFVPDEQHLLYRGRVSSFNHEVDTDEMWYYYVCAVNTRGTEGEFSNRVSASTVRITTPDILFGSVTNDILADLAVSEDKIQQAAIQTAHIADLAVNRAHLQHAIIENVHIEDATIEHGKIKSLNVDRVVAGEMDLVHLKAGTISTDKFLVRGGSATDYAKIEGSEIETRGQYTRTWFGERETHDVGIQLRYGRLRFHNYGNSRNLYFSETGIATYISGSNEDDDGQAGSGVLEFFSHMYNSTIRGVTLYSNRGIVALRAATRDVIIDSKRNSYIYSGTGGTIIEPHRDTRSGRNSFYFGVKDNSSAAETDGYLIYGSLDQSSMASGLRFKKSRSGEPLVWATDGSGSPATGSFWARSIYADLRPRGTYAYVRAERLRVVKGDSDTDFADLSANEMMAHSIRKNTQTSGDSFYAGVSTGELRVTNNNLWGGSHASTVYRDVRASGFTQASSRVYKTNINSLEDGALDIINDLRVVNYILIADPNEQQIGFISEDSPSIATIDGMAINTYKLTSYNTKAIQEVDLKFSNKIISIEDRLDKKDLKIQLLEQKVALQDEKIKHLENLLEVA